MEQIVQLLDHVKHKVEQNTDLTLLLNTGEEFESHIQSLVEEYCSTEEISVKHNGKHSFPDLSITFNNSTTFGLEIKFSASGNWYSKGNSIFESISENIEYKDIYVIFGRKPKSKEPQSIEIKYDLYGNAIDRIEVTHSPRFSINMNTQDKDLNELFGETLTYAEFRTKTNAEKNDFLRNYFSINKDKLGDKWYFSDSDVDNKEPLKIQPLNFSKLEPKFKNRLIAEAFILFPNDLLRNTANYDSVAKHFITQHFVYSSSLRDSFSAGGKTTIFDDKILYPKTIKIFYDNKELIKELLENPPYDNFATLCCENWSKISDSEVIASDAVTNESCSLLESYSNIIKNLKPTLEIKTIKTTQSKKKATIIETNDKELKVIDLNQFFN